MVDDLAGRTGWSVVAVEPFPGQDLGGAADPPGFEDRSAALRAMNDERLLGRHGRGRGLTGCEHVGLIGFCMGGMYAMKALASDRFDQSVAFYGMVRVPEQWRGGGQGDAIDVVNARAAQGTLELLCIFGTEDPWCPAEQIDEVEAAGAIVIRYEGADHGWAHVPDPEHAPTTRTMRGPASSPSSRAGLTSDRYMERISSSRRLRMR